MLSILFSPGPAIRAESCALAPQNDLQFVVGLHLWPTSLHLILLRERAVPVPLHHGSHPRAHYSSDLTDLHIITPCLE